MRSGRDDTENASATEKIKSGIAAAPGIAIGRAYLVDRRRLKVPKKNIEPDEVDAEVERFHRAIEISDRQLERIKKKIEARSEEHYNIIAAHQLMLHDEHLVDAAITHIRDGLINAEWALRKTVEDIRGVFNAIEDDYFRERRSDVEFVGERILRNLMGREVQMTPPPDAIIVAYDLSPADTAQFYRAAVSGIITDAGGKTSHTAIIARAHEIPAVVGLEDITSAVGNDDLVIVDGAAGVVIISPTAETVSVYRDMARKEVAKGAELMRTRDLPAQTQDGAIVTLCANIDQLPEVKTALQYGAETIGLFRTEFLYMMGDRLPSEEDHFEHACSVMTAMDGRPVTFRTMDLGADKMSRLLPDYHEVNPALGLRSIRLCLSRVIRPLFRQQLRGLLRASVQGNMRLMFPMISGVKELRLTLEFLEETKEGLRQEGLPFSEALPIGIMIEMPSAVLIADHLAKEVDFFSIGTNDLIQYTLAVDRVNEHVAYLYEPLHPALLRLIDMTVKAARQEDISVSLCGEMAGDLDVAPILLGLGLRELSMNAVSIPSIKEILRRAKAKEWQELARAVKDMPSSKEVREAAHRLSQSA